MYSSHVINTPFGHSHERHIFRPPNISLALLLANSPVIYLSLRSHKAMISHSCVAHSSGWRRSLISSFGHDTPDARYRPNDSRHLWFEGTPMNRGGAYHRWLRLRHVRRYWMEMPLYIWYENSIGTRVENVQKIFLAAQHYGSAATQSTHKNILFARQ